VVPASAALTFHSIVLLVAVEGSAFARNGLYKPQYLFHIGDIGKTHFPVRRNHFQLVSVANRLIGKQAAPFFF
jgi:hypothetical protein